MSKIGSVAVMSPYSQGATHGALFTHLMCPITSGRWNRTDRHVFTRQTNEAPMPARLCHACRKMMLFEAVAQLR